MDSLIGVKTPNRQEQAAKRRQCMHMHIITPPSCSRCSLQEPMGTSARIII
jgi:hypothetical protein